jgi:hypothetical protein
MSTTTLTLCTTYARLSALSPAPSSLMAIRQYFVLNALNLKSKDKGKGHPGKGHVGPEVE